MKQRKFIIMIIIGLLFMVGCNSSKDTTDTNENKQRIVVTSLEVAMILDAMEVDDVVGIVCEDKEQLPERYKEIEIIEPADTLDMTVISNMNPTLIIGTVDENEEEESSLFVEEGIDSAFINFQTLPNLIQSIKELGEVIDKEAEANALVDSFNSYIKAYHEEIRDLERPKVMILYSIGETYQVVSETTYVGSIVKLAGGINVFGDTYSDSLLEESIEDIRASNPSIIISIGIDDDQLESLTSNQDLAEVDAIKNQNIIKVEKDIFDLNANLQYQDAMNLLKGIFYSS